MVGPAVEVGSVAVAESEVGPVLEVEAGSEVPVGSVAEAGLVVEVVVEPVVVTGFVSVVAVGEE